MIPKKQIRQMLCLFALLLSFFAIGCNNSKTISYQSVNQTTSKKDLVAMLDSKPKETISENGVEKYIYKCTFLDYEGTMTYSFAEENMMTSRWQTTTTVETDAKSMYQNICKEEEKNYGKGTSTDTPDSMQCKFTTEDRLVVVNFITMDGEYEVSVTEMEQ